MRTRSCETVSVEKRADSSHSPGLLDPLTGGHYPSRCRHTSRCPLHRSVGVYQTNGKHQGLTMVAKTEPQIGHHTSCLTAVWREKRPCQPIRGRTFHAGPLALSGRAQPPPDRSLSRIPGSRVPTRDAGRQSLMRWGNEQRRISSLTWATATTVHPCITLHHLHQEQSRSRGQSTGMGPKEQSQRPQRQVLPQCGMSWTI